MPKSYIKHISIYTPSKRLLNKELSAHFDLPEDKIFRDSGVKQRYIADKDEISSDFGIKVGSIFFEEHPEINRDDIDLLLMSASVPDYKIPSTCCLVHEGLELQKNCGAMDIPMGCAGFSNGIALCKGLVESGSYKNILLITIDLPSKVMHPDDYQLRILFSDVAAATLISTEGMLSIGKTITKTDGSGAENLIIRRSGAQNPVDLKWLLEHESIGGMRNGQLEMNGEKVFKFMLKEIPELFDDILLKNELAKSDIDFFIFHHASKVILKSLKRKLRIEEGQLFHCLENYGNTVSSSIPVALYEFIRQNKLTEKNNIFIAGFGIGYSWSGTILKAEKL